jgi:hypothetical protein
MQIGNGRPWLWEGARVVRSAALAAAALLLAAGCRNALEVQNQQDILDANLNTPDAIVPLKNGVAGDFAVAYANAVNIVGLFGGELIHTGSFPSWEEVQAGIGTRPSSEGDNMYNQVERVMWDADTVAVRIASLVKDPSTSADIAEVSIWGGFAHFMLADNYCQGTVHAGAAVSTDSLYRRAEAILTQALTIATAANKTDFRLRALAGRARARLNLKNYSGALADVSAIPVGWRFNAIYSANSSRENNTVATLTTTLIRREAGVNPRFYKDSSYIVDPRTPFLNRGDTAKGPDPTRQFVEQLKYPQRDAPIAVSSWQEARLIAAEANTRLGNTAAAIPFLNQVREAASLPDYTGPATQDALLRAIEHERSAELWLQAQSLNDLRRFNDPYLPATKRDKCFEIGLTEWNSNPNLGK